MQCVIANLFFFGQNGNIFRCIHTSDSRVMRIRAKRAANPKLLTIHNSSGQFVFCHDQIFGNGLLDSFGLFGGHFSRFVWNFKFVRTFLQQRQIRLVSKC